MANDTIVDTSQKPILMKMPKTDSIPETIIASEPISIPELESTPISEPILIPIPKPIPESISGAGSDCGFDSIFGFNFNSGPDSNSEADSGVDFNYGIDSNLGNESKNCLLTCYSKSIPDNFGAFTPKFHFSHR